MHKVSTNLSKNITTVVDVIGDSIYPLYKEFSLLTYTDKLKFWYRHRINFQYTHFQIFKNDEDKIGVVFSNVPENPTELNEFIKFVLMAYKKDSKRSEQSYFETVEKCVSKKSKIEFTHREIERLKQEETGIITELQQKRLYNHLSNIDYYKETKKMPILHGMESDMICNFLRQKNQVVFKEFLELQIERLEKGETDSKMSKEEYYSKKNERDVSAISLRLIEDLKMKMKETGTSFPNKEETVKTNSLFSNLEWANRTEMVELVFALSKSLRIRRAGQPLNQKQIIELFSKLFSVDLDNFHNLLNDAMTTHKRNSDGKFFTAELFKHVEEYLIKVREKERK
ncbi:MAG: hypothetical protein ABI723_18210 [Bacteroidia bacterium]